MSKYVNLNDPNPTTYHVTHTCSHFPDEWRYAVDSDMRGEMAKCAYCPE